MEIIKERTIAFIDNIEKNTTKDLLKNNNIHIKTLTNEFKAQADKLKNEVANLKMKPLPDSIDSITNLLTTIFSFELKNPFLALGFELTILSILGYFSDNKEKKMQKKDPLFIEKWDPIHFMSSLFCSIFIVEDKSLAGRASLITERHGLNLNIFSIEQAINYFS